MVKNKPKPNMLHAQHKSFRFTIVLLLAIMLLIAPACLPAAESLTPEAANAHAGETRTICGKVANTYYSRFVKDKPTFVNFGRPYPNHVFSIAILGANRDMFENAPEDFFTGKSLCVTGLIETYDNKPLIVVRDKMQIRITE